MKTSITRIVIFFLGFALIFVLFSFFIGDGKPQYAMEIASAFMGCIITVIITCILLNKQTENELEKERNAKIVEEKIKVYNEILETIEKVLTRSQINRADKLRIQLIKQKLIQIASKGVIDKFNSFWDKFSTTFNENDDISNEDLDNLLKALSKVSWKIREDIDPSQTQEKEQEEEEEATSQSKLPIIEINSELELEAVSKTPEEHKYFDELKQFVLNPSSGLTQSPGRVGFSIKKAGKPVVWYYPITETTPNNLIFHIDNLSEAAKNILKESKNANLNMKRSPLKLADMPVERLKKLLEVA